MAVVIGLAMIASAGLIMSNVLRYTNHVVNPEEVATISITNTTQTPTGDLTDYQGGTLYTGIEYDFNFSLLANQDVNGVNIVFDFSMAGITVGDVDCYWWDGSTWQSVAFNDLGDTLQGNMGDPVSLDAGQSISYFVKLLYNTPGDYVFESYVEQ